MVLQKAYNGRVMCGPPDVAELHFHHALPLSVLERADWTALMFGWHSLLMPELVRIMVEPSIAINHNI